MNRFGVEKSFREIFATFAVYFMSVIELSRWDYLIYQPTSYYALDLIEEFYVRFVKSNVSNDCKSFELKWQVGHLQCMQGCFE